MGVAQIKFSLDRFFFGHFYGQFTATLKTETEGMSSILDLGCGFNPPLRDITINMNRSVGIDVHRPSLEKARIAGTHSELIESDVMQYLHASNNNSFDCVMALDLIEHLEKEDGKKLIDEMCRVAKRRVILFTPNGFVPQKPYDNNPWQEHKSGWPLDEMRDLGFRVYGFGGWKSLRGERFAIRYKPRILWKFVAFYSQVFTYKKPKRAYSILCVKDL